MNNRNETSKNQRANTIKLMVPLSSALGYRIKEEDATNLVNEYARINSSKLIYVRDPAIIALVLLIKYYAISGKISDNSMDIDRYIRSNMKSISHVLSTYKDTDINIDKLIVVVIATSDELSKYQTNK